MSRKRDTNWSRDEITVLLDSILEITKRRAEDGKRTNSREVFEYAAKKMGEKGHSSRAEREKCRTKWKKMKEEFTQAKRARDGDARYKEAPGIQPFYDRMKEFINGNFDNISPHSTIVRRASSSLDKGSSSGMRTSARIAANTNGAPASDNNDTSSTTKTNTSTDYPSTIHSPSIASPLPRQNSRLSSGICGGGDNNNGNHATTTTAVTQPPNQNLPNGHLNHHHQQQQLLQQASPNDQMCIYTAYNTKHNNSTTNMTGDNDPIHVQTTDHADISYRVSTGCRQITIFGDHDVDIKFRAGCVTINKIVANSPTSTDT